MEQSEIRQLFARASVLKEPNLEYLTPKQWVAKRELNGAKTFKRKALGLCGKTIVKSLDEMATLLHNTGVASSLDEGRELTPRLVGNSVPYKFLDKFLFFEEVKNSKGHTAYRISVCAYIYD